MQHITAMQYITVVVLCCETYGSTKSQSWPRLPHFTNERWHATSTSVASLRTIDPK